MAEGPVVAAGCFDALSARLAEHVGFQALHITGFGVEATQLGAPDIGLLTLTEMASHAARIAAVVETPIICDVDTGYGGVDNVTRTVREFERAGVSGIHIEDQTVPKKCPALNGRTVVSREEGLGRIGAALDARTDPGFVIVARTDADTISTDELISRCNAYLDAGADLAMPMLVEHNGDWFWNLSPDDQMEVHRHVVEHVHGPTLGLTIPKGYELQDMLDIGYSVFILPTVSLDAAVSAMVPALTEALQNGHAEGFFDRNPRPFVGVDLMNLLGLEEYLEIERKYGSADDR